MNFILWVLCFLMFIFIIFPITIIIWVKFITPFYDKYIDWLKKIFNYE